LSSSGPSATRRWSTQATDAFDAIIADQRASGAASGDHFAKPGANDRVWNALEKLAVRAPSVFAAYYANDILALVSAAWLGPAYQITSQVNVVNPGGDPQTGHRDYHLGFMSGDQAAQFPAHAHRLSPVLTLQGAVAHCDMPVESGPTMYLPHSQKYEPGYVAAALPDFQGVLRGKPGPAATREGRRGVLQPGAIPRRRAKPLVRHQAHGEPASGVLGFRPSDGKRGSATDVRRALPDAVAAQGVRMAGTRLRNIVAACAEGYAFPTNLDRDQPVGGMAPQTQAELVWQAVAEQWDPATFRHELAAHTARRDTRD
jgi:ectoine hydroxylase-related dioxygenase (phytanoyl-CoA dioxygenase family)